MEQPNDIVLLKEVAKGDQRSFQLLYNKYWHQLYVAANRVLQEDLEAEDIVQEVFTSLWRKAGKLQVDNLNAYLYQAIKFQVANKLRQRKGLDNYLKNINEVILEKHPQIEDKLHYASLLKKIGDLPEKCREVFIRSHYHHLTNAQIALELGISIKTVENQINKALKHLRNHMDDYSLSLILPVYLSVQLLSPSC
jgi:RNA polymerase sigma-70 factor (family 1)